jgi:hypothetical protein
LPVIGSIAAGVGTQCRARTCGDDGDDEYVVTFT